MSMPDDRQGVLFLELFYGSIRNTWIIRIIITYVHGMASSNGSRVTMDTRATLLAIAGFSSYGRLGYTDFASGRLYTCTL